MRTPRPRPGRPRWLRLPRRTARLRLTVLYGGAVFLACGATVLAVTYLLYGQLGNATLRAQPVVHLHKHGRVIPIAIVQPAVTIRMTGLGQLSLDRQQLLIASGIALAVIAVAAAAIGWLIAGQVLRPLSTITAAARRISASSLHERLALHGPDDELKELADTLDGLFARLETSFDAQRRPAPGEAVSQSSLPEQNCLSRRCSTANRPATRSQPIWRACGGHRVPVCTS